MKKGILILLTLALLIGAVGVSAMAMGGPRNPMMGMKDLNLTADQQKKILEIRQAFEKETLAIRQALQTKMSELRELWAAQSLDQNKINAKTQEITPLRVQLMTKSREMQDQMKKVLTPDQLKKLETMKTDRMNQFRQKEFSPRGQRFGKGCGFNWNQGAPGNVQ